MSQTPEEELREERITELRNAIYRATKRFEKNLTNINNKAIRDNIEAYYNNQIAQIILKSGNPHMLDDAWCDFNNLKRIITAETTKNVSKYYDEEP